ncbi:Fanconi anemia group J protein, variant 2 [Chamberlinius hualienensis]
MATNEGAKSSQIRYHINGLEIYSPYNLYASQKMMITKTLTGLQSCRHCLLESPTGSGKTLAMLCAALAWQEKEYELRNKELIEAVKAEESKNNSRRRGKATQDVGRTETQEDTRQFDHSLTELGSFSDDDDFKPVKRFKAKSIGSSPVASPRNRTFQDIPAHRSEICAEISSTSRKDVTEDVPPPSSASSSMETEPSVRKHIPKIYYGTRTHKQITQIIRELRKTAYRNVKMTILGSRNNTCVHPRVSQSANKNDLCQELMPKKFQGNDYESSTTEVCSYYLGASKLRSMNSPIRSPWDIEDLKLVGSKNRFCPYFHARDLADGADIVFCPYQYLIDPIIRKSMNIGLSKQILILDEAHNIEDVARTAASFSITDDEIHDIINDLEKHGKLYKSNQELEDAHGRLASAFSKLNIWLLNKSNSISSDDGIILSGVEMVSALQNLAMGPTDFDLLKNYFTVVASEQADLESPIKDKMSTKSVIDIEHAFLVIDLLYGRNLANVEDYRICLKKVHKQFVNNEENGKWRNRRSITSELVTSLSFLCLNPALVFGELGDTLRSIIVTSGTLSPIDSFESELGIKFPIRIEAPHVIGPSQVLACVIGKGPNDYSLNGSFQNTSALRYQDELGETILNICKTVPHGILCFFPSYTLMNKLSDRWQSTGLWNSVEKHKIIVTEPRQMAKNNFEHSMAEFFNGIDKNDDSSGCTGSLLLAVYRGKVSEGIDFPDNYARAVIAIGIPFPNLYEQEIKFKREYNDKFTKSRGLLSGSRWYEIQAFRAFNQALGRCIRHSADWGAIFLVDDRLHGQMRYVNNISKWVRQYLRHLNYNAAIESLQHFIHHHKTQVQLNITVGDTSSLTNLPVRFLLTVSVVFIQV